MSQHSSGLSGQALFAFQNSLREQVREEFDAQREQLRRIWEKPLEERVEEGFCLTDLEITAIKDSSSLTCRLAGNDSRFREGDYVVLSMGNPEESISEAIVIASRDEEIELALWKRTASQAGLHVGSSGLQLDVSAVDLEKFYLGALDELGSTLAGKERILPLLMGELLPKIDMAEYESSEKEARKAGFDDPQATAVASALGTDLCWLIHGPPGTGKTRVLAWIVQELLQRGERILVTGANHRTINNLLEAIEERVEDRRLLAKITPFRDHSLGIDQYETFGESHLAASNGGYVIGATPFALRTKRLKGVEFDTIVVDEASQVTMPLAIMAMLAGRRYLFAGDHQQLPPVSLVLSSEHSRATSIFGKLVGRGYDTMLKSTRRLNTPLCRWSSDWFYRSELESHPSVAGRRLHLPEDVVSKWTAQQAEVLSPGHCSVWVEVPHGGANTFAPEEAEVLCEILFLLQDAGVSWRDVGVVVPFRRQARMIRRRLGKSSKTNATASGLVIDTVERMQGQEREIILVSFATSNAVFAEKMIDFLFQPQRLNVAATRAKTKLILLASPELLAFSEVRRHEDRLSTFRSLLTEAHRVTMERGA